MVNVRCQTMRVTGIFLIVAIVGCAGDSGSLRVNDPANGVFKFDTPLQRHRGGTHLPEYGELRLRRAGERWACAIETDGPAAQTLTLYESRDCPVREFKLGYCFDRAVLRDVVAEAAGRPALLTLEGCVAFQEGREITLTPAITKPVEICRRAWTADNRDVVAVEVTTGGTSKRSDNGEWLVCWEELGCDSRHMRYEVVFADGRRSPVSSSSVCMW